MKHVIIVITKIVQHQNDIKSTHCILSVSVSTLWQSQQCQIDKSTE